MSSTQEQLDEHDEDVSLIHKTPKKVELNKHFTTKTLQQQLDEAIEQEKHKNNPPETYNAHEEVEPDIDSYAPEKDKKKLREIHIWPSNKHFVGTENQAILAKWHERSGHICDQYLLRTAKSSKGMEEVASMPSRTSSHTCDACRRAKSKHKHKTKYIT